MTRFQIFDTDTGLPASTPMPEFEDARRRKIILEGDNRGSDFEIRELDK